MRHPKHFRRRGAAAAAVAVTGTVLIAFAALAIDMGVFYNTRIEAQRSADAGALAGAWKLLGDERVKGATGVATLVDQARQAAAEVAGLNEVFKAGPQVDLNVANAAGGDIILGRLDNPSNLAEPLATAVDPSEFNSVSVLVRRDNVRNGPIPFFFGQIFGFRNKDMSARAVATARNTIAGYRVTNKTGNAQLLPFTVHVDAWNGLLNGTVTTGDNFRYDPVTKTVSPGSDGIYEINMYPGAGNGQGNGKKPKESSDGQLPPGNFGTVDIGAANNSTADISRQIRYGISAADLAHLGGELRFNNDGKIYLNGDTGLSAAVKDDLEAIKGQPRAIPLFTHVSGPGNNATYTIVAFAGIRVMDVKLTGSMSSKAVIVQPAVVVDDAVIVEDVNVPSYFVYYPPSLVR
ncbi:MAG TPA: TadG family pilus assembly protein [Phycisphaerae bacterium]|nr:TadG family pilus assembly protein [Phycisphaerae bacterium]HOJ74558.1 TadG family pilus assembly protein [Phycisphaerae bacterium]HOM52759.1 TadG family pilus assembly protein [Phycisphaerae bacterium]HON66597.1 TadG family pilus assembly protein [Phycisphaerae bacterium]HOQ86912.1 TadG family pilus assembly protein [Phycisphaerae bacterium]